MKDLVARWDAQQAAYIAGREERFSAMLDVLALTADVSGTVVDLGCGPGSLSRRILDRFPSVSVIAIDYDPVLLTLARSTLGPRARVVDADLLSSSWSSFPGDVSAMVSTTALHWLQPAELVRFYGQVWDRLAPGGVLLDGDHFRFSSRDETLRAAAAEHDAQTQRSAFEAGAEDWETWWGAASSHPELAPHVALREERYASRVSAPATSVEFRLAALRQAGFGAANTVWQLLDDYVVWAQK